MAWHFRGSPAYLTAQGDRLGLSRILSDRARHNPEIHRVSILLGQLCERYHRAPKAPDGAPAIGLAELAQIRGTLGQAEDEAAKLHALAASAGAMLDEAHRAFGLDPPSRPFRVRCDFDDIPSAADLAPIKVSPERSNGQHEPPRPKAKAQSS